MPGRLINDNILLASELIKGYNRKHMTPRAIIKIDLRNAYDSLDWGFLESMLHGFNFPSKFIGWFMECVRTVRYFVMLKGYPLKEVKAQRVLDKGITSLPISLL